MGSKLFKFSLIQKTMLILAVLSLLIPVHGFAGGLIVDGTGSELKGGRRTYQSPAQTSDDVNDFAEGEDTGSSSAPYAVTRTPAATLPPAPDHRNRPSDSSPNDASSDVADIADESAEYPGSCDSGHDPSGSGEAAAEVTPVPWEYTQKPLAVTWQGRQGTLLVPGVYQCTVALQKEEGGVETMRVPAREVTFETTAPADQTLAVVKNTKSGYVKLLKVSSNKSIVLEKPKAGEVIPVLAVGRNFAKVNYRGCVGYVRRDFVALTAPAATDSAQAQIAYRGNVRSHSSVKVRAQGSGNSRVVGEFRCGTYVSVLSPGEKWTQVEAEGVQCYILSEFLSTSEKTAAAREAESTADP